MDTNVSCIEPNLAIYLKDGELKHYNLIYGQWQYTRFTPSYITYITNMLLMRTSDGYIIPPAYPTTVELQTIVTSLDYDGEAFWSVQPINNTPNYPGWVIRKWQIEESLYAADCIQFKSYPGFYKASCLAVEYYRIPLRAPTDSTKNYVTINLAYDYIMERLKPGFKVKIGPNATANKDIFWGTVKDVYTYPKNSYLKYWYVVEFEENLNASYLAGHTFFFDAALYVFTDNPAGELKILNPVDLSVVETYTGGEYSRASACAFTVVNNVPNINVGQKTQALFYVRDMVVYCKSITNMDHILAAQVLLSTLKGDTNSFYPVYELRIRNDHPDEPTNYPQHYLLQKGYREDGRDGSTGEWGTYNYILQKLHAEPATMIVDVQPQFLTLSGIAECSCRILDNYNFPLSGVEVQWSHTCGDKAEFLWSTTSGTDVNGYVYNKLYIKEDLDFPAYVTATTDEL